jgi:HEAT repeat protein
MRPLLLALLALGVVGCPRAVGPARTPEEARTRVGALLDAPDAGAAEFAAVGAEAPEALAAVLVDPAASTERRLGATRALGALPDGAGLGALARAVALPGLPDPVRDGAAEALGASDREAAVQRLSPLLGHTDAAVRGAAARGLGRAGGPGARKSLEERLELEEDPAVRERLQAALARVQP